MTRERNPAAHLAKLRKPKSPEHLAKISESLKKYWQEAKSEPAKEGAEFQQSEEQMQGWI